MDVYTQDIRVNRVTHSVVARNWRPSWAAGVTAFGSPCNSKIQTAWVKWQLDISQSKWHQGVFWSYSSGTPDKPSSVHHCSRIYSIHGTSPNHSELNSSSRPPMSPPPSLFQLLKSGSWIAVAFVERHFSHHHHHWSPTLVFFLLIGRKIRSNCVPELSRDDWVARAR